MISLEKQKFEKLLQEALEGYCIWIEEDKQQYPEGHYETEEDVLEGILNQCGFDLTVAGVVKDMCSQIDLLNISRKNMNQLIKDIHYLVTMHIVRMEAAQR